MDDRNITLLYASETGSTEDYAQDLGRTLERLHFNVTMLEMDALEPRQLLTTPLAIFMCPTTGQGDMPENMQKFWRFLLRRKLPVNLLSGMRFTTFGCGSKNYPKFNWAVKKLHKRLLQLGAQEFYIRGEGDEQHEEGIDGALIPWITGLTTTLLELFPLPAGVDPIPSTQLLPPKLTLSIDTSSNPYSSQEYSQNLILPRGPTSFPVTVTSNTRLTPPTHFQDTRLLTLSLPSPPTHSPGDALSILATNPPSVVEEAIEILKLDIHPDQPLTITSTSKTPSTSPEFITPLTLRTLLTHHLDPTAIPRRSFFSFIAQFCDDETHKERLIEFTDPKYVDELFDYTTRPRRSILEVLQEFGSVRIPLEYLLEVMPRIKGRLFSIASASTLSSLDLGREGVMTTGGGDDGNGGYKLDLLIAIVKYKTVIKKIRRGMCTRYIESLREGDKLQVSITKGGLGGSHTTDPTKKSGLIKTRTPVVMIAPGTGVAPMRALVWERLAALSIDGGAGEEAKIEPGKNLLFFGCRDRENDYYFCDEWEALERRYGKEVFEIHTAFSRDSSSSGGGGGKTYVQHLVKEQKEEVYRLLVELEGCLFVCGSSGRMPMAVREAILECLVEVGGWDRERAEAYIVGMEGEGRWRQETW